MLKIKKLKEFSREQLIELMKWNDNKLTEDTEFFCYYCATDKELDKKLEEKNWNHYECEECKN